MINILASRVHNTYGIKSMESLLFNLYVSYNKNTEVMNVAIAINMASK